MFRSIAFSERASYRSGESMSTRRGNPGIAARWAAIRRQSDRAPFRERSGVRIGPGDFCSVYLKCDSNRDTGGGLYPAPIFNDG